MKKFLILVLTFSLLISAFLFAGVTAAAEEVSPYQYATAFVQSHARRDILSGGEGAAANTLSSALAAKGYAVTTPSFSYYAETENDGAKVAYQYKHVIGFKDNGKKKSVVIGAYYGGFEPQDSYGVGNGGTAALSVGTLLYIAEHLASATMNYNLVIAFWGGIEISGNFSVEDCGVKADTVALYVNVDGVAAGTRDYLYADDVPRSQEKFFRKIASKVGANLAEPPVYKKQAALSYSDSDPYNYSHIGLLGVNRFFMGEGVPSVNFFGGAWDYDCGFFRYEGKGYIEGTSLDTIAELDTLNGGPKKTEERMLAVANVVITGLTDQQLPSVLDKAAREITGTSINSSLAFYLISFIGTAVLFAAMIIIIVKQGKDRKDNVWQPSVNGAPGEDPYEEFRGREEGASKENENSEEKDDFNDKNDDVFRF